MGYENLGSKWGQCGEQYHNKLQLLTRPLLITCLIKIIRSKLTGSVPLWYVNLKHKCGFKTGKMPNSENSAK